MKNFYKVSNTIENGPRMDRVKSRISPMDHRLWTVIAPMLFIAFGLFGVNEMAWAGRVTGNASVESGVGEVKAQIEVYVLLKGWKWKKDAPNTSTSSSVVSSVELNNADTKRCKFVVVSTGTGYSFSGWYDENGNRESQDPNFADETVTAGASRTYTYFARFAPIQYNIAFNANYGAGGTGTGTTATVANVKYDRDTTLTLNGYSKIAYTVSYNANGGSGLAKSSDNSYYSFDKWTQNSNGSGTQYANGATVSNLSATDKATVTLYAKWGTTASKIILPVAPSVAPLNKTFAGWFVDGDAKETVVGIAGDEYTPTGNVTLKAKWTSVKIPGFTGSNQTLTVGETYNFGFSNTSTATPSSSSSANFYYVISDEVVKTDNTTGSPDGTKVISFSGNTVTALNKGTAKIKFYQEADAGNNIVAGESAEFTITVNKKEPTITWASAPYNYNSTINNFYSSDNKDTEIAAISRNTEVASISGATLTTYNKAGSARIVVSQAENYKWAAKKDSISVTPEKKNKHVEFTINADNNGNIEVTKTANVVWQSTGYYKLGTGDWGTEKPDDNVVIGFEGIPDKLSFTLSCDPVEFFGTHYPGKNDYTFEVFESATNGNWNSIWTNDNSKEYSKSENVEIPLSASTRFIKLRYSGTCWGRFTNIAVSELQYFRRQGENTTLDFATNVKNQEPAVQSFVVEHANAGYQTSVTAPEHYLVSKDNVNFASEVVYSTNETAVTGGDKMGTFTVYVKYLADAIGTHNANVTVHNNLRTDFNVPVTGTTKDKIATQIEYCGASSYSVDAANIASTTLFRVRDIDNDTIVNISGVGISLSCAENDQFSIVGGNALDPKCGGTNNVKPSFAGNDTYAAATNNNANFAITITRLADEINFDNARSTLVVGDEIDLSGWASAESESEITYEVMSSDQLTGSIKIENGKLIALSAGTVRIKATSEGNCLYNSGYDFHNMKVRNPGDPCGSLLLDKSATVKCGITAKTSESPQEYAISAGPMDELKFKIWRVATAGDQVTIRFVDKDGNAVPNGTYTYSAGSLGTSKPDNYTVIDVSNITGATKLQIYGGGLLNKYVSNVQITQKAYLTTYVGSTQLEPTANVTMPEVKACNTSTKDITIKYSDLTPIQLSHTNDVFTYEIYKGENKVGFFDNDCRGFGTYTVRCICTPTSKGEYSDVLTLTASGQSQTINLSLNANAPDRTIVWDIPTSNTITATQSLDLTAYAETSCQSPAGSVYYTASPADAVTIDPIDGNHITFKKAAAVTVTAHTVTSEDYNDAPTVDKVWTVSKVGVQMTKLPTITSTITYGDTKSVVAWDNKSWVAVSVLNDKDTVQGIIDCAGPDNFTTAGPQDLTFNFYPTNVNTYDVLQFTVPVTVQQMASVATPVAANITYGHRVNESVLSSGAGSTTLGTWAWKDEAANTQVLDASADAYTGLNVIFTPDDSNYSTIETTVSLKVDKADPEVTVSNVGITYGATASSVALSGTGDGEWSWDDSRAAQTLAAGVYNDMAVKFTPTDGVNYNELSTTITLTVSKADPVATASAVEIMYGATASSVDLEGTGVAGTWSWTDTRMDDILAAGSYTMNVHFIPNDATNYNEKDATVELTVKKATTTLSWTSNPTDLAYNATDAVYTATSASDGAITYSIISGGSYAHIDANTGALTIDLPGNTITIQAEQAEGTNYSAPTTITVEVAIAAAPVGPNSFTNNAGDNDWQNAENWTNGVPSGVNPDVIISGALIIDESVTVGGLTILPTGGVTVITHGTLTVNGTTADQSGYGDLHVKNDGAVILGNSANLQVRDFKLDAKLGDGDTKAASGQVKGDDKLNVNGDAYFQLSFDPAGAISYGWYDFTVPFPVNISGGIERINSTSDKVMVCGQDFLLMEDDEVSFVNGGKGWRQISSGVLEPGKLYTITFDDEVNQNTFRFAWNGQGSITNGDTFAAQCLTGSDASRNGWNALGNAMLQHGYVDGSYKLQAYDHTYNVYEIVYDPKTFAVGTAFFVQVLAAGDIDWTAAEATLSRPLYAPQREAKDVDEFRLSLRSESNDAVNDVLFFSASEEAIETYMIGHDLLKKGTPTEAKKAQMWAIKDGKNLCDVEATLVNDEATTPLNLYAPNAGQYILAVEEMPEDANLYLTYNGNIIWDLTASPYVLDLTKGTTTGYALRIVAANAPQITTGVDDVQGGEAQVRKVIIDNKMYIITPEGAIFDAIGKKVQ